MFYRKRVVDLTIDSLAQVFNAISIVGPKGCGKTTTAKMRCRTTIEFQDEEKRENYLRIADISPSFFLRNERPILFDEWRDAPKIWGVVRKDSDDHPEDTGSYFLTGSSSRKVQTPHTGTLRISTLKMYPMSLYESGLSNGEVSLMKLFDQPDSFEGCSSPMTIDDVIDAICIGGWPRTLAIEDKGRKPLIAKDLYRQTYSVDMQSISGIDMNPRLARAVIQSYARNICTMASVRTIFGDVASNFDISNATFYKYEKALEDLCIVENIEAWSPSIRSRTTLRSALKRNFVDPSIAAAALGISPGYFQEDFKTLGFLFESLCIRDLKVYSSSHDGIISYYHDRYGLEADAVLHLEDGRYALIEFKLGEKEIEEGAEHLCKIESLVREHKEKDFQASLRMPTLKLILTAGPYGYRRKDGVLVIPIGSLKD